MKKKKILIYIDDDLYIRNYFTYGSFDLPDYELAIYANRNVTQKHVLHFQDGFKGYLTEHPKRTKLRTLQSSFQMMKFLEKSKSFQFRFKRYSFLGQLFFRIFSLPIISQFTRLYIHFSLLKNKEAEELLEKEKPDLIIVPSQVVGSISSDILETAKIMQIPSLFLIDGWDNISSKTVFSILPDYLAVWGEQSVKHAVEIQNFPKKKVFTIGTPRFESYCDSNKSVEKIYDFSYVVFTGCAIPFDEISVLKILDYSLSKHNIKNVKIIYRPHPWRQTRKCFDYFIQEDFTNVIMDKQISDYYYASKILGNVNAFQPTLEYYPKLLNNCLFVISPLTTMIIEAAIVNKRVLTLAYDDGCHFTNPSNALKNYEHFKGIEGISAFNFCYDINNISEMFIGMVQEASKKSEKKKKSYQDEVKHIIQSYNSSYSQRLKDIIKKILTNPKIL